MDKINLYLQYPLSSDRHKCKADSPSFVTKFTLAPLSKSARAAETMFILIKDNSNGMPLWSCSFMSAPCSKSRLRIVLSSSHSFSNALADDRKIYSGDHRTNSVLCAHAPFANRVFIISSAGLLLVNSEKELIRTVKRILWKRNQKCGHGNYYIVRIVGIKVLNCAIV